MVFPPPFTDINAVGIHSASEHGRDSRSYAATKIQGQIAGFIDIAKFLGDGKQQIQMLVDFPREPLNKSPVF